MVTIVPEPPYHTAEQAEQAFYAAFEARNIKIMRVTDACNQACVFCPASPTSENVITDYPRQLRQLFIFFSSFF